MNDHENMLFKLYNVLKIWIFFLASEDGEDIEAKLPAARVYPPADNQLLTMPTPVSSVLYGRLSNLYIREAVCACREVTVSIAPIVDALVQVLVFTLIETPRFNSDIEKKYVNFKIGFSSPITH